MHGQIRERQRPHRKYNIRILLRCGNNKQNGTVLMLHKEPRQLETAAVILTRFFRSNVNEVLVSEISEKSTKDF
jgi:hypothetical protein